ncbi:FAD-dependent oxidoreductase, partial [Rhodohalobacter sulfatireducens]
MTVNRRDFLKGSFALAGGVLLPSHLINCTGAVDSNIFDIVVYGATSGGVIAAVSAARKGKSVILIEPSNHLGGLTTGGLGRTDIGIEGTIGGMSLEFYSQIREYYKSEQPWVYENRMEYMDRTPLFQPNSEGMFGFEPKVAKEIYEGMLNEAGVSVVLDDRLILGERGVTKRNNRITAIETEAGNVYKGKMFIDATYEGDLLAMAGVTYHVGRESNSTYDETLNGVQKVRTHNHIFPGFV